MASITVRGLDAAVKTGLRLRAARHGRSMEEEVREILRLALALDAQPPRDLAAAVRRRFESLGGVELPLVGREPMREPPDFGR